MSKSKKQLLKEERQRAKEWAAGRFAARNSRGSPKSKVAEPIYYESEESEEEVENFSSHNSRGTPKTKLAEPIYCENEESEEEVENSSFRNSRGTPRTEFSESIYHEREEPEMTTLPLKKKEKKPVERNAGIAKGNHFLYLAALIFGIVAIITTSPRGVVPPFIPEDSQTLLVSRWPWFRVMSWLNEFCNYCTITSTPPNIKIFNLATGSWKSEILYTLTKNNVIELVGENSITCIDAAKVLELKEHAVCGFMDAGFRLDIFTKDHHNKYSLTPSGNLLRKDTPGSLRDFTLLVNEEISEAWRAFGTKSIITGNSGFSEAKGEEIWDWHKNHKNQEAQFHRAMSSLLLSFSTAVILDLKFPERGMICDIGGGVGTSSAAVLEHYPELKAIIFDQEEITNHARSYLSTKDLSSRAIAIGGNFFKEFPNDLASCDIFLLSLVLHDWGDEESIIILRNILQVAKKGSRVILVEHVTDTDNQSMELIKSLMNVNTMANNLWGAKERSFQDYSKLLKESGFKNNATLIPLRSVTSIIEIEA